MDIEMGIKVIYWY